MIILNSSFENGNTSEFTQTIVDGLAQVLVRQEAASSGNYGMVCYKPGGSNSHRAYVRKDLGATKNAVYVSFMVNFAKDATGPWHEAEICNLVAPDGGQVLNFYKYEDTLALNYRPNDGTAPSPGDWNLGIPIQRGVVNGKFYWVEISWDALNGQIAILINGKLVFYRMALSLSHRTVRYVDTGIIWLGPEGVSNDDATYYFDDIVIADTPFLKGSYESLHGDNFEELNLNRWNFWRRRGKSIVEINQQAAKTGRFGLRCKVFPGQDQADGAYVEFYDPEVYGRRAVLLEYDMKIVSESVTGTIELTHFHDHDWEPIMYVKRDGVGLVFTYKDATGNWHQLPLLANPDIGVWHRHRILWDSINGSLQVSIDSKLMITQAVSLVPIRNYQLGIGWRNTLSDGIELYIDNVNYYFLTDPRMWVTPTSTSSLGLSFILPLVVGGLINWAVRRTP